MDFVFKSQSNNGRFNICFSFQYLFLDMDDFVRNKLSEWGLSKLIETFEGKV